MDSAAQDIIEMCEAFYLSNEAKPFSDAKHNSRLYAADRLNPYDHLIMAIIRRLRVEQANEGK